MKPFIPCILLSFLMVHASAQSVLPSSIEDSAIGWVKVYHFKGAKQPLKVDANIYSVNQLSICDSIANWIQASYIPTGGLGDVKRFVLPKIGLYNKNTAALPPSYGAYARIYRFLKKSGGKLVPENNLGPEWSIVANAVPGWEAMDLSTTEHYYFTMPSFDHANDSVATKKAHDLGKLPKFSRYTHFWIKDRESGSGADYLLISKNNRSPFVALTKGAYLDLLEKAIPRVYAEEKKKLYEKEQGNMRNINYFMGYLDEKNAKRIEALKQTREKYRDRLGEIALTVAQPSLNDLDNGRDVFSNGYLSDSEELSGRVPIYTIDSAMAALCKKDSPQWLLMIWQWTPNVPVERHLHESIMNNLNLDYLYHFFFEPEKVKGQPYQPLRSPSYKEAVVVNEGSQKRRDMIADKNIFYFEDFSTTTVGKNPVGWKAKMGPDGTASTVQKLDGLEGSWAVIGNGYILSPKELKTPLPNNFSLSFDLVATQNFTWGAKALAFQLSKETAPGNAESFVSVKIRPGYDGREGETEIETQFNSPPGYLTGTKWYKAPGFSNDKKNNRIRVTIQKKEESLLVLVDQTRIAEYSKAVPAALLFNALSFSTGWLGQSDRYYISNIRIIKE